MDYYNSFVIQPMLLHLVKLFHHHYRENEIGTKMYKVTQDRFRRYARVQEAIIAPDGFYPPVGRSLTYTSLYMATMAFLPLGLPQDAPFWTDKTELSTWKKWYQVWICVPIHPSQTIVGFSL